MSCQPDLVDGIKYERLPTAGVDAEWEMLLFKNEELVNYLTALQVDKPVVYEYAVYDSEVERIREEARPARGSSKLREATGAGLRSVPRLVRTTRTGLS